MAVPILVLSVSGAAVLVASAPAQAATGTTTTLAACRSISSSSCPTLSSASAINFGQTVELTATVAPTPSGAGSTVTFTDAGNASIYGAQTPATLATVALAGGKAETSQVLPFFGTNTITATYSGNAGFSGSASAGFVLKVNVSVLNRYGTLIINELRPWGPAGTNDNYLEIYDNSVATTNQPVPLAGWRIVTNGGDIITLPPTAPALIGKQTFLITGADYSLGVPGDLVSADLGSDASGVFGFELIAPDSLSTVTDTVGSDGSATSGDLPDLVPPGTAQPAQWTWTRLSSGGLPINTGDNLNDFLLVSNSTAAVGDPSGSQSPALGSPSPEAVNSPYQQTQNLHSEVLGPPASTNQNVPPNRIYVAGHPGSLVVQRTITNDSNANVCDLQVRVTSMSEKNGGPQPNVTVQPHGIADLRMVDPSYVGNGAVTAPGTGDNPTAFPVENLSPDAPGNPTGGGAGQDTTLTVPLAAGGLPMGDSVQVSFTFAVDTHGEFWFGYNTLALTPGTGGC